MFQNNCVFCNLLLHWPNYVTTMKNKLHFLSLGVPFKTRTEQITVFSSCHCTKHWEGGSAKRDGSYDDTFNLKKFSNIERPLKKIGSI